MALKLIIREVTTGTTDTEGKLREKIFQHIPWKVSRVLQETIKWLSKKKKKKPCNQRIYSVNIYNLTKLYMFEVTFWSKLKGPIGYKLLTSNVHLKKWWISTVIRKSWYQLVLSLGKLNTDTQTDKTSAQIPRALSLSLSHTHTHTHTYSYPSIINASNSLLRGWKL